MSKTIKEVYDVSISPAKTNGTRVFQGKNVSPVDYFEVNTVAKGLNFADGIDGDKKVEGAFKVDAGVDLKGDNTYPNSLFSVGSTNYANLKEIWPQGKGVLASLTNPEGHKIKEYIHYSPDTQYVGADGTISGGLNSGSSAA